MGRANAFDVIEACYRFELDDERWLDNLSELSAEMVGSPLGALIYSSDGTAQRLRLSRNFSPEWVGAFTARFVETLIPQEARHADPLALTTRALAPILAGRCTPVSAVASLESMLPLLRAFGGARDLLTMNGYDPAGRGLSLGIPLLRRSRWTRERARVFSRVTTHLAAAHRLRLRLREQPLAEGILDGKGRLVEGRGDEILRAQSELRTGVVRLDRARSLRRDADRASALWTGLVAARWTLVDDFSLAGKRYVLARRNDLPVARTHRLTDRETQVMAHAAAGRTNKEIAYELGLADSTVRVLLLRAAAKLGVSGRTPAIERFRLLTREHK